MISFVQRSSLLGNQIPDYLEYGWVCAPNTAGQSITANTITTLTLDTEVADAGEFGSISSNQVTLGPGTYYYEASTGFQSSTQTYACLILSLYNTTDSVFVGRHPFELYAANTGGPELSGQFTITSSKTFELRALATSQTGTIQIKSAGGTVAFTNSTAGADQRTTLKLWRFKESFTQDSINVGSAGSWTSYASLKNLVAANAKGQSITADTVETVQLAEFSDDDGIVSVSGNQFTLGAGIYQLNFSATYGVVGASSGQVYPAQYYVWNVTDGAMAIIQAQSNFQASTNANELANGWPGNHKGSGVVSISSSKVFELRLVSNASGSLGSRISDSLTTSNINCLASVDIYKR